MRHQLPSPPGRAQADRAVAAIAARQHGLVTVAQLQSVGLTGGAIARRAEKGRLNRVHHGVYAVGHRGLTIDARYLAAVLRVGEGAVLSHRSAAALWGLVPADAGRRRGRVRGAIEVEVTCSRRCRVAEHGILVHETRHLPRRDVTRQRAIPVTAPGRTLLDLAEVGDLPDHVLRRAVREAEVRGLVRHGALIERLAQARGRQGMTRLRRILAPGPAPTRSELEDRTLSLLLRNGFPRPAINVRVQTAAGSFEVDFLYASRRLIIEADGARFHGGEQARRADAERQAALEAAGYRVIRVTWHQVTAQESQTVVRLKSALNPGAAARRAS